MPREKRRASASALHSIEDADLSDDEDAVEAAKPARRASAVDDSLLTTGDEASRCRAILQRLYARPGSARFAAPVEPPSDSSVPPPLSYASIEAKLEADAYGLTDFGSDVRQIFINAIAQHWDPADDVHQEARQSLETLESALATAREDRSAERERATRQPVRREERDNDEVLRLLQVYITGCGGREGALDGWSTYCETRKSGTTEGTTDQYFVARNGKRFRSRAEVARHLRLDPAAGETALREERQRNKEERDSALRQQKAEEKEASRQ